MTELDENTVAYHVSEPLGVVGQIIPVRSCVLMTCVLLRLRYANLSCTRCCQRTRATTVLQWNFPILMGASSADAAQRETRLTAPSPHPQLPGSWRRRWRRATPWC